MRLELSEIQPGIVSFLEPSVLVRNGAACSMPLDRAAQGQRPFVCLKVSGDRSLWTPLGGQNNGGGRTEIPQRCKSGHSGWVAKPCFIINARQTWRGPNEAFVEASRWDSSRPTVRNRVTEEAVKLILEEADLRGGWTEADGTETGFTAASVAPEFVASEPLGQSLGDLMPEGVTDFFREEESSAVTAVLAPPVRVVAAPASVRVSPGPATQRTLTILAEPPDELPYDEATFIACQRTIGAMEQSKKRALLDEREELEARLRDLKRALGEEPSRTHNYPTERAAHGSVINAVLLRMMRGPVTIAMLVDDCGQHSKAANKQGKRVSMDGAVRGDFGLIKKGWAREAGTGLYELTPAGRAEAERRATGQTSFGD